VPLRPFLPRPFREAGPFDWGARDAVIGTLLPSLAALLLASPGAPADSSRASRDSVYLLPEVRVERERASAARRRLPTAFVTELSPGTGGRALETLSDVIGEATSVHVTQYGGLGAFSTASVRGGSAGQVAVLLDGVPLNSGAHGIVNLSDLPATAVERIEVYRGLTPFELGAAGAAGAINLVTTSAPDAMDARVASGSFGTWEARGTSGLSRGPLSGLLHLGYQGSRGDFRFPDNNGTPFNRADDTEISRANNRFESGTALAGLTFRPAPGLRLSAREDAFEKRQGVPGLGASQALHTRLSLERSLSHLDLDREAVSLWPALRLHTALLGERTRFRDPLAELGLGRHDTDDRLDARHVTLELGWPRLPGGLSFLVTGLGRAERARLHDGGSGRPDPPESRRATLAGSAGLELQPLGEWLTLHAAKRWDRERDRLGTRTLTGAAVTSDFTRELDSPQLGLRAGRLFGFELRSNWSRSERSPEFLELFGNQGSVVGNPSLRPERVEGWDAGGAWSGSAARIGAEVEWAHFESLARDLIIYWPFNASSSRASNISRATIRGEELSARLSGPLGFSARGSFTWQTALDRGPLAFWHGKRLPEQPGREAYVRLDWARGALRATAELHAIGDNYLDRYNSYRVEGRTLVGGSLSAVVLPEALSVTVEGKNLGDSRVSDVAGCPLPGRSVFVSCQARLGAARAGGTRARR